MTDKIDIKGIWEIVRHKDGQEIQRIVKKNTTPDAFLEALAYQSCGENTTNIGDNIYIALGTGTDATTTSDTQLQTETVRKALSDGSVTTHTGKSTVFFTSTEVSGTYEEFGLFSNGKNATASSTPNSGILNSRITEQVILNPGETLTCTFNITYYLKP